MVGIQLAINSILYDVLHLWCPPTYLVGVLSHSLPAPRAPCPAIEKVTTHTSDNQPGYIHHHIDPQAGHVLDGECLLLWYLCVLHQLGQVL